MIDVEERALNYFEQDLLSLLDFIEQVRRSVLLPEGGSLVAAEFAALLSDSIFDYLAILSVAFHALFTRHE